MSLAAPRLGATKKLLLDKSQFGNECDGTGSIGVR